MGKKPSTNIGDITTPEPGIGRGSDAPDLRRDRGDELPSGGEDDFITHRPTPQPSETSSEHPVPAAPPTSETASEHPASPAPETSGESGKPKPASSPETTTSGGGAGGKKNEVGKAKIKSADIAVTAVPKFKDFVSDAHKVVQPTSKSGRKHVEPFTQEQVDPAKPKFILVVTNAPRLAKTGTTAATRLEWAGFKPKTGEHGEISVDYNFQDVKFRNKAIRKLQGVGIKIKITAVTP
jgi:hypothetical protein|nr:MAG TPA: hypothetical protein [Caudoviricetes sp.]